MVSKDKYIALLEKHVVVLGRLVEVKIDAVRAALAVTELGEPEPGEPEPIQVVFRDVSGRYYVCEKHGPNCQEAAHWERRAAHFPEDPNYYCDTCLREERGQC